MNNAAGKTCFAILFLVFLSAGCNKQPSPVLVLPADGLNVQYNRRLSVAGKILNVEVVSKLADMEKGLSGRDGMKDNEGMLFDFGTGTAPGFWMKDMKFGLDLVWIEDGKIAGITKNVPVPKFLGQALPLYYPPSPVNVVLEVNAGWAEKNNIAVGDEVRLNNYSNCSNYSKCPK